MPNKIEVRYVGNGKKHVILSCILNEGDESVEWLQNVKGSGTVLGLGALHFHSIRNNYSKGMIAKMKARNVHCIARDGVVSNVSVGLMGDAEKLEEDIM